MRAASRAAAALALLIAAPAAAAEVQGDRMVQSCTRIQANCTKNDSYFDIGCISFINATLDVYKMTMPAAPGPLSSGPLFCLPSGLANNEGVIAAIRAEIMTEPTPAAKSAVRCIADAAGRLFPCPH